jgi:hypothetical protein
VCRAPKGLVAVEDIPLSVTMRGLMWNERQSASKAAHAPTPVGAT